ncbi:hypothetical protein ACFB49_31360 [Sphingomonas sp. DBB INV C78]|uniref:hypothetical protein n=1 Tax=Sphingomonas sp. DBB INV C78 TaxID=3349434 RepID=UPI0036D3005C
MMGFSTNQWVVLVLVLLLGWLLGLASRSGSGKWGRAYEQEHAERLALAEAQDARVAAANARITERERVRTPAPAVAPLGSAREGVDDLTLIRGIDRNEEVRLNDAGYFSLRDIAAMRPADEAALEARFGYEPGHIARQHWSEQAEMLLAGRFEDHRRRFY